MTWRAQCLPPRHTHLETWFIEWNGILLRGEHYTSVPGMGYTFTTPGSGFTISPGPPDLASLQESRDAFRSQVYTAGTPASFTISVKDIYGNTRKVWAYTRPLLSSA